MGAGILPTTIHNNKLYFLFGKENKYEDSASGFSDFGGGTDNNETFLQTAIREGTEELTGFLGSDADLSRMLKRGTFTIDHKTDGHSNYRMHIFSMDYDEALPHYYNNNQRFLQKRLDPSIIKKTKIFEKAEIRWMCIDELPRMRKQFRSYFQAIVDKLCDNKDEIMRFIRKRCKKGSSTKRAHLYSKKSRTRKARLG
jgi:8-oxo-dGTP pyrophosphatase MutT (NUDIX family)